MRKETDIDCMVVVIYVVSLPGDIFKGPHSHYLDLHTESDLGLSKGRELTARFLAYNSGSVVTQSRYL